MPEITVLMPVHNGGQYLKQALDSLFNQTFKDFELLVVDDASTDDSKNIVVSYKDVRLRMIENVSNIGIAQSLNRGVADAKGRYIVRMDADDVCFPQRLQRLLDFMRLHPEVAVAGSWAKLTGKYSEIERRPIGSGCVKASLCLYNPLIHPSVIIRKDVLTNYGIKYDRHFSRSEDYDLWSRLSEVAAIDNIAEVLLNYRVHGNSITAAASNVMEDQSMDIMRRELHKIGITPSKEELRFHRNVCHGDRLWTREEVIRAEEWFGKLIAADTRMCFHKTDAMRQAVAFVWFRLCRNSANLGPWVWKKFRTSALSRAYKVSASEMSRLIVGIVVNMIRKPTHT